MIRPQPNPSKPLDGPWQTHKQQRTIDPLISPTWAKGGHLQTLLGHLLPSKKPSLQGETIEVTLPDGDRLRGIFYPGTQPILVYLFHGLGGSTNADYMQRALGVCNRLGYAVLCMNHRGCGSGRGLARHPYHSGRGEDLGEVFRYGRANFPQHLHLAVGFSLSGNALLLLLSGQRGNCLPDGAISINAPINLGSASRLMQQGLNRIYESRFVIKCQRAIREKRADDLLTVDCKIPFWISLEEVDRRYTAPAGGFANPQDYYQRCSTYLLLDRIGVPTVLLTSRNDPFVPASDYQNATISPWVLRHIESSGGHMGYLTAHNHPVFGHRWMDYALDHYLSQLTELSITSKSSENRPSN